MPKIIPEYSVVLPHRPVVFKQVLKSLKGFKNSNVQVQTPKMNRNILEGTLPVIFICLFIIKVPPGFLMCWQIWEPLTWTKGKFIHLKMLHPIQKKKHIFSHLPYFLSSLLNNRFPLCQISWVVTFSSCLEVQDERDYVSIHNRYLTQEKEIITNINIPVEAISPAAWTEK